MTHPTFGLGILIGALTVMVMLGGMLIDVTQHAYKRGAVDQASGRVTYVPVIVAKSDTVWVRVVEPCGGGE